MLLKRKLWIARIRITSVSNPEIHALCEGEGPFVPASPHVFSSACIDPRWSGYFTTRLHAFHASGLHHCSKPLVAIELLSISVKDHVMSVGTACRIETSVDVETPWSSVLEVRVRQDASTDNTIPCIVGALVKFCE